MIASIDYLDSKCKEILAPLHLRVQAMDGSNFTVEVINTPMIFNGLSCVLSSFFKVDPIWSEIVVKGRSVFSWELLTKQ